MNNDPSQTVTTQGVQELIDEIRQQGVEEGKTSGARIIADAEARAQWMLDQAKEEAQQIREAAEREALLTRQSGNEALQLARRDLLLRLRDEITQHLSHELISIVQEHMSDEANLAALLTGIAARVSGEDVPETLLLPDSVMSLAELRANPEVLREGALPGILASALQRLLEKGVTVLSVDNQQGCRLEYQGGNLSVDLSPDVLGKILLAHLQPRFRALLDGVVK